MKVGDKYYNSKYTIVPLIQIFLETISYFKNLNTMKNLNPIPPVL